MPIQLAQLSAFPLNGTARLCRFLLPLALCAAPVSNFATALNDTGITRCVDATTADPTATNTANTALATAEATKNSTFAALAAAADKVNLDASAAAAAAALAKAAAGTALASATTAFSTSVATTPTSTATASTLLAKTDSVGAAANNNAALIATKTGTYEVIPSTVVFANAVSEANFATATAVQVTKDAVAENAVRMTKASTDAATTNALANTANVTIASALQCVPVSSNLSTVAAQVNAAATRATASAAAAKLAAGTALASATTAKTTADNATAKGVAMPTVSTALATTLFATTTTAADTANTNATTIANKTATGAVIPTITYPTASAAANVLAADAALVAKQASMVNAAQATTANTDAAQSNARSNQAVISVASLVSVTCTTTGGVRTCLADAPLSVVNTAKSLIETVAKSAAAAADAADASKTSSDTAAFQAANDAAAASAQAIVTANFVTTYLNGLSPASPDAATINAAFAASKTDAAKVVTSTANAALAAKAATAAAIAYTDAVAAATAATAAAADAAAVSSSIDAYVGAATATATCTLGTFPTEVTTAKTAIESLALATATATDKTAFAVANEAVNTVIAVNLAKNKSAAYDPVLDAAKITQTDTASAALSARAVTNATLASTDATNAATLVNKAATAASTVMTSISAYNTAKSVYDQAVTDYGKAVSNSTTVVDPTDPKILTAKAKADADKCLAVSSDAGAYPRQDGRYGRDADNTANMVSKIGAGRAGFDFTKIAMDGSPLPAATTFKSPQPTAAKDWACTKDNVTGLIWEIKTTGSPRSRDLTYTWFNSKNDNTNGGAEGVANGGDCSIGALPASTRCDTEKYVADVNAITKVDHQPAVPAVPATPTNPATPATPEVLPIPAGLCGCNSEVTSPNTVPNPSKQWRLPTVKELESIVDFSGANAAAIDLDYFPNTNFTVNTWTASPLANYSSFAWAVNFKEGNTVIASRDSKYAVRLVCGGQ